MSEVANQPILELQWGSSEAAVPDSDYIAEFCGLEQAPEHKDYGPGIRWVFRILEGANAGRKVGRIGPAKPRPKNASGVILRGLTGKDGVEGEVVSIKDYIGRKYKVVVVKGRVEYVFPLPK